jgi:murein DD-endopeptidase MepM/ murein hydrolase activator NlpD
MGKIFIICCLVFFNAGCATTSSRTTSAGLPRHNYGIYHTVESGETLWRISRSYDVDIQQIIYINKMESPYLLVSGQRLFIPDVRKAVEIDISSPGAIRKGYVWPVKGRIVSYYGTIIDDVKNKGIDIAAAEGSPVVAARSGKVVFADGKVRGMGNMLIIEHGDGYSTLYAYNSENLVSSGEDVRQGQIIAKAGRTGRAKTASLHFQIRKGHEPQNPHYYLP